MGHAVNGIALLLRRSDFASNNASLCSTVSVDVLGWCNVTRVRQGSRCVNINRQSPVGTTTPTTAIEIQTDEF
eukprot:m.18705 g.18705  ORF g.18705 m.18705 type:complete len:73 (+) comp11546_c0_seq3:753-971(+)